MIASLAAKLARRKTSQATARDGSGCTAAFVVGCELQSTIGQCEEVWFINSCEPNDFRTCS
jgi:hypothetical protein